MLFFTNRGVNPSTINADLVFTNGGCPWHINRMLRTYGLNHFSIAPSFSWGLIDRNEWL